MAAGGRVALVERQDPELSIGWSRAFPVPAAYLAEHSELAYAGNVHVGDALRSDGWTVPPTGANFVWLRLREETAAFAAACARADVSVQRLDR